MIRFAFAAALCSLAACESYVLMERLGGARVLGVPELAKIAAPIARDRKKGEGEFAARVFEVTEFGVTYRCVTIEAPESLWCERV